MSAGGVSVDITSVVVFGVFGILLGVVLEVVLRNFQIPIPYVVIVFYVGVIIGSVINGLDIAVAEFLSLSSVSSDLIVFGFLPSLLFSETMGLNLHHLFQSFTQALILAGPGAVVVCIELAVAAYFILPYGWSWMYCFLFSSILCATDPVSVVSLMKSTHCSTKLTMVISGESLLNDGSAMILFLFFYNMINGEVYTAETFIAFCAEMLILSPLVGFISGLIASRIMRRLNTPTNSHLDFQLVVTFICAYISYYIAASVLGVSGVLSCCCAGFTVSVFAPVRVLHDEKFHQIWSYAEWCCNTLIFLLAGIIGAGRSASSITGSSVGYLVAMFFVLCVTRGVMTFLMVPFLNRAGEAITVPEASFITFAGLRGALCIALALEGARNATDNGNDKTGKELFFMVVGLASFTLLFNGSTAGWVLLKLKLVDDPNAPISPQLAQVLSRIRTFISSLLKEEVEKMKSELGEYDEKELSQLCEYLYQERRSSVFSLSRLSLIGKGLSLDLPRNSNDIRNSSVSDNGGNPDYEKSGKASMRVSGSISIDRDLLHYTRTTFLDVVRARYTEAIHTGKMSSTSFPSRILYYSVDVAMDGAHEGLKDWDVITELLQPNKFFLWVCQIVDDSAYFCCRSFPGMVSWLEVYVERIAIYVITNFIYAHEYAQAKIHYFLGGPVNKEFDIAEPEHRKVMEESKAVVKKARELLKTIRREDLVKVYTHRAAKIVLLKQAEILHEILHDGILSEKNAANLFESLERERDRIHLLRSQHEKVMVKENIKDRVNAEKEIRESVRMSAKSPTSPDSSENRPSVLLTMQNLPRSNLRLNLTGEDNLERLSTASRTRPSFSTEVFRPSGSVVSAPPTNVVSGSYTGWDHNVNLRDDRVVSANSNNPMHLSTDSSPKPSSEP